MSQDAIIKSLNPLNPDQLALRLAPNLRSFGEITAHIIGARARWFYQLMGEGGDGLLAGEASQRFLIQTLGPDHHFVGNGFVITAMVSLTFDEDMPSGN